MTPDPAPATPRPSPTLAFTHAGKVRRLVKHPRIQDDYRQGRITETEALAKPWYLRAKFPGQSREKYFALSVSNKQAVADALDKLNGAQKQPEQFKAWLAERENRRGLTVGALAADWLAAGCPFSKTKPRTGTQAAPLEGAITRALEWWSPKIWRGVEPNAFEDYVVWRRGRVRARFGGETKYTGDRTADLELAALSCLGDWALLCGQVESNPFAKRPRFQSVASITHCHAAMPDNDEALHQVLRWLFTHRNAFAAGKSGPHDPVRVDLHERLAGGALALMALSGLRPGEPRFLRRATAATEYPANLETAPVGLIYPMPDGTTRMKVQRLKRGQNPAITITPALKDFLGHWYSWLEQGNFPGDSLFPISQELIADQLKRACAALKLPALKPHGFGRAYYVRVRRSQGADDATIAVELGQSSNGDLIRNVYGDPKDPVGGNLHDWLPRNSAPAWRALTEQAGSIVTVQFG